jgi:AraC-like DNA-binding protein
VCPRHRVKASSGTLNLTSSPLGSVFASGLIEESLGTDAVAQGRFIRWSDYYLVYTLEGAARYEDEDGHRITLRQGSLLVLFPGRRYRLFPEDETGWTEFYLKFGGPVFELWESAGLLSRDSPVLSCRPVSYWLRRLRSVAEGPESRSATLQLQAVCRLQQYLADALLAGSVSAKSSGGGLVARACAVLDEDPSASLDLKKLAKEQGVSYEHFRKLFSRAVGMPPARYRALRAIERACQLMRTTSMNDKEIAYELGFASESYFSRRFKELLGMTPSAFRASSRPERYPPELVRPVSRRV